MKKRICDQCEDQDAEWEKDGEDFCDDCADDELSNLKEEVFERIEEE